jgi:hypothetical protein
MNATQKALNEYEAKPVQELIYNAQQLVSSLCLHGPKRHWVMSVPVEPSDSDIVLSAALTKASERIAELERQNETLKGQIVEYEDTWLAINREIALLEDFMENDDTWENADPEDLYQFDPWACLRKSLEFMQEARRQNELLRAVGYASENYWLALENVASPQLIDQMQMNLYEATQAAIDGAALETAVSEEVQP